MKSVRVARVVAFAVLIAANVQAERRVAVLVHGSADVPGWTLLQAKVFAKGVFEKIGVEIR